MAGRGRGRVVAFIGIGLGSGVGVGVGFGVGAQHGSMAWTVFLLKYRPTVYLTDLSPRKMNPRTPSDELQDAKNILWRRGGRVARRSQVVGRRS